MAWLKKNTSMILLALLFTMRLSISQAGDYVPVMLWCNDCSSDLVNPLQYTSTQEFENILNVQLGKTPPPPVIVFVKDNFCVEDIQHCKKSLEKFNNLGLPIKLKYLTSVESALSAFNNLLQYNITNVTDFDAITEGQLAIVKVADLDSLPEKLLKDNKLKELSPNLVVALTGNFCMYTSSIERIKREIDSDGNNTSQPNILFHTKGSPFVKFQENKEYHQLGKEEESKRSTETDKTSYNLTLYYNDVKKISNAMLKLHFNKSHGYYKFLGIEFKSEQQSEPLYAKSKRDIEFPYKYGYHCGQNSTFSKLQPGAKNTYVEVISIKLPNFQVQMDTEKFGEVYDCIGFMSIPIWTGIFVTVILALILIWGITMILDIRTMDRFDDPKGKTITISAQE